MKYYAPLLDQVITTSSSSNQASWLIPLWEEPQLTENTSFKNNLQFVWDSVSLTAFQKCPRYYNWTVRLGYRLDPQPSTLSFGIHFHKVLEVWHKLLSLNITKEEALLRCARLAGLLGEHIIPGRNERTKETLVRATIWYLDQFKNDNAVTTQRPDGSPAVEYSFMIPFKKIEGQQMFLAGHIDRIVEFMDELYVLDYKTTKSQLNEQFFAQFKPNTQVSNYLLAAKVIGGTVSAIPKQPKGLIIDGIQLGVNFNRFNRSVIPFSTLEINEHIKDLETWLHAVTLCAKREHWPANPDSCTKYGSCTFRSICSGTPANHERLLKANFSQSTWDPRQSR